MKSTIYNQQCTCDRAGCPGNFAANKSRRYHPECSRYIKQQHAAKRAAASRAAGTDTISVRKRTVEAYVPASAGVKDGQTRKPSADWPERRERIRAMHGVKLPKKGEYTL